MWLYSYPSILLSTSHQNGGAVLEQWGPVSQSPVGQEVTSLRTRLSTPPMLGLAVLVLTIVPAYLLSRPNATDTARTVVSIARSNDSAEAATDERSEEHTSELQSRLHLVCRLLLEKKKK